MMNRKGKWEGCSLRAHFHRVRDVWVRGSIAVKERSFGAPSGESPMEEVFKLYPVQIVWA